MHRCLLKLKAILNSPQSSFCLVERGCGTGRGRQGSASVTPLWSRLLCLPRESTQNKQIKTPCTCQTNGLWLRLKVGLRLRLRLRLSFPLYPTRTSMHRLPHSTQTGEPKPEPEPSASPATAEAVSALLALSFIIHHANSSWHSRRPAFAVFAPLTRASNRNGTCSTK